MKNLRRFFVTLFLSLLFFTIPTPSFAQTQDWETLQGELDSGYCVMNGAATIQGIVCLIANVLSVALTAIGLAGFVMMIVGALTWLLSGGKSENIEKARKTMTFAIVGLIVALSSYIIINLISTFTGISVIENFMLPSSDTGIEGGIDEWRDYGEQIDNPKDALH